MKRVLYFDCFSGISGDMALGALIDLGVDTMKLAEELIKLGVPGYHIEVEDTERNGIAGTDVDVIIHGHEHGSECGECGHHHADGPGHPEHIHDHGHTHTHEHGHRSLGTIRELISESEISERAKELSISIFETIGRAEAHVHQKTLDEVHFHEVGAIDSLVDIVGTAICMALLEIEEVYCSPVHEGSGFVDCQHGRLPVPVPAVMEMLAGSGITLVTGDVPMEMVTPTGFGILKGTGAICNGFPAMDVLKVGYGFGKRDTGKLNGLRVVLGEMPDSDEEGSGSDEFSSEDRSLSFGCMLSEKTNLQIDQIAVLETNLDDERGEILGYTMERLFEAGALDVFFTPIHMKKNRPAVMLTVLCEPKRLELLSAIILTETATLGVRVRGSERITLKREVQTIDTVLGSIRMKAAVIGEQEKLSPEYEDCARIARENGIPLAQVYALAMASLMD